MAYDNWKTTNPDDAFLGGPPEVWQDCHECGGEGSIEIPHPFHDDPYYCRVLRCEACNGVGGMICEAEGDR